MEQNSKDGGGFRQLYQGLVDNILKGKGISPEAERQAAFDNIGLTGPIKALIENVATAAYRVTEGDMDAVRQSGKSEDEIFELVICGAVGQASRQYKSALATLQEVIAAEKGGQHAS